MENLPQLEHLILGSMLFNDVAVPRIFKEFADDPLGVKQSKFLGNSFFPVGAELER